MQMYANECTPTRKRKGGGDGGTEGGPRQCRVKLPAFFLSINSEEKKKVWESFDVYYYAGSCFLPPDQWQTNRTVEAWKRAHKSESLTPSFN